MGLKNYYNLAEKKLFLINRSITGNGTIKTLQIIKRNFKDLKIRKIKSGTKVYDWKIPPEWNVDNAYVDKDKKNIDFKNNNLHLVGYSNFINKRNKKNELLKHLSSIPSKPKAIPYVTSYYKKYWGFCISEEQKREIKKNYKKSDSFRVLINSKFKRNGFMNYGELFLPGKQSRKF